MSSRTVLVPYPGQPPIVAPGELVECRTAYDHWITLYARSKARYDVERAIGGRRFLTVAVGPWNDLPQVNWPAEHVRRKAEQR